MRWYDLLSFRKQESGEIQILLFSSMPELHSSVLNIYIIDRCSDRRDSLAIKIWNMHLVP
jgi:hypothetical protein